MGGAAVSKESYVRRRLSRRFGVVVVAGTLALGLIGAMPFAASAQVFRRVPCVPCPREIPSETTTQPERTGEATGQAGVAAEQPGEGQPPTPPSDLFAQQDVGAPSGPESVGQTMIGDFFGGGLLSLSIQQEVYEIDRRAPLPGASVPRFKMAENTSPLPQDRIYFDYSFYRNVPVSTPDIDVSAFTLGFEETFLGGAMSFEMRLPMSNTIGNDVFLDGRPNSLQGEVGNLGMAFKGLLVHRERFALSAGLAMTVPTAQGTRYFVTGGDAPDFTISNDSVHLMPFVGGLWTPSDRFFAMGYLQVDVDANGDGVLANDGGGGFTPAGRFSEPTVMYIDLALGYWARRSDCTRRLLTGLAYVVELHMNQALGSSSTTSVGEASLATPSISVLDLTVGAHLDIRRNTTLTAAFCTPLTNGQDRQFDGQFRLFVNRRF